MRFIRGCIVLWRYCATRRGVPAQPVLRFFLCAPHVIYQLWRHGDFRFHRSWGGLARRLLGIDGHALLAFILPAGLLAFFIFGPGLGYRGLWALLLLITSYLVIYVVARRAGRPRLLAIQLLVFAGLAVILWWAPLFLEADSPREALASSAGLHRHVLVPLFLLLVALPLLLSASIARLLLSPHRGALSNLLPHAELLSTGLCSAGGNLQVSAGKAVSALLTTPVRYPLHLLFWPAAVVVLAPDTAVEWVWALATVLLAWFLLSLVAMHARFEAMIGFYRRALFTGAQLAVSLVVILLGVGRLAGFSYVETVLEAGATPVLVFYILSAYFFLWYFEYWLNRALCEQLVEVLGGKGGKVPFDLREGHPCLAAKRKGRAVQVHAGARLLVVGTALNGLPRFRAFEKREFLEELWSQAALDPQARPLLPTASKTMAALKRTFLTYFAAANVYLAIASGLTGLWAFRWQTQIAVLEITKSVSTARPFDLASAIEAKAAGGARGRLILLSASGGGTRAALYTASVLRGLEALGALEDLALASGVSGGGVALAAYAGRQRLDATDGVDAPEGVDAAARDVDWDDLSRGLSYPFIHDVLRGVPEWRIFGGVRSGTLLAESFGRELALGLSDPEGTDTVRLGDVADFGLILNTTLAGGASLLCDSCTGEEFARRLSRLASDDPGSGVHAGGRLIFTNLETFEVPPLPPERTSSALGIPYVVLRDPGIPLAAAAALNANFPPVFSNAPIDVHPDVPVGVTPSRFAPSLMGCSRAWNRYMVTDGGATDNRGLISLFLALRSALPEVDTEATGNLPKIHIIMADASAGSTRYSEDRGIGSKLEATGKVANQLIAELLEDVGRRYRAMGGELDFHDLSMPEMFRIDGGLSTHWMLPTRVELLDGATGKEVVLDSCTTRIAVDRMHAVGDSVRPKGCDVDSISLAKRALRRVGQRFFGWPTQEENLETVESWMRRDAHRARWNALCKELSDDTCLPERPARRSR